MMKRRTFFSTAFGTAALAFLPGFRSNPSRGPIVIIGAGLAGLTAARSLHRAGHRTLLLEAASHLGGRLPLFNRADSSGFGGSSFDVGSLAGGLDLRLGTSVQSIEHSAGGLRLTTSAGQLDARAAIVTLPPSVLNAIDIDSNSLEASIPDWSVHFPHGVKIDDAPSFSTKFFDQSGNIVILKRC